MKYNQKPHMQHTSGKLNQLSETWSFGDYLLISIHNIIYIHTHMYLVVLCVMTFMTQENEQFHQEDQRFHASGSSDKRRNNFGPLKILRSSILGPKENIYFPQRKQIGIIKKKNAGREWLGKLANQILVCSIDPFFFLLFDKK